MFSQIEVNSNGSKQWDKTFIGSASEHLSSMIKTTDGNYLLARYSCSGVGGEKSQTSKRDIDFRVIKKWNFIKRVYRIIRWFRLITIMLY
jgi:hypothetical protein